MSVDKNGIPSEGISFEVLPRRAITAARDVMKNLPEGVFDLLSGDQFYQMVITHIVTQEVSAATAKNKPPEPAPSGCDS